MYIFRKNKMKPEQYHAIDLALKSGTSQMTLDFLTSQYKKCKIDDDTFEAALNNSKYIIDLKDLVNKYKVISLPMEDKKIYECSGSFLGTCYGDIAGSLYEFDLSTEDRKNLTTDNCLQKGSTYTDDTILTCATAMALTSHLQLLESPIETSRELKIADFSLDNTYPFSENNFATEYRRNTLEYPGVGYGPSYYNWALYNGKKPYGSYGNGSAMRVSPIGAILENQEEVIVLSASSAAVTHNHPEGIKGAIITAMCVWMAKSGYSKQQIFDYMMVHYKDFLDKVNGFTMDDLRLTKLDKNYLVSCMYSVPVALICFYYSHSFEDVINNVLSFYGDTDTIGAIACGIAGAYYDVPESVESVVKEKCNDEYFNSVLEWVDLVER